MSRARLIAVFLVCAVTGGLAIAAEAAKPTQKEALAACRAQYGKKVTSAVVQKDGKVGCYWEVRREMTRQEAYDACKKKHSATTIMLRKTKGGWMCRYYGRY